MADAAAFMASKVWSREMPVADLWPSRGRGPSLAVLRDGRGAIEFVARARSGDFVRTEVTVSRRP
jgi:hypothetical protein